MATMINNKLPETLYARAIARTHLEDPPVAASDIAGDLVEKGIMDRVGVYKLVGYVNVRNVTELGPLEQD